MKWKKLVLVALAATMAIGAAGCGSQQKADSGKGAAVSGSITGSGSSALLPLVKDAAENSRPTIRTLRSLLMPAVLARV